MPAVIERNDDARLLRRDVALHDVRSAHEQSSGALEALHRLEPRFNGGKQLADGAGTDVARLVRRQHRRALGYAVAFEHFKAETFFRRLAGLVAHAFGAADGDAQGRHAAVRAGAHILRQEGVGGEQHRRSGLEDPLRNDLCLQRRGMKDHRIAVENRPQRAGGQAVAMESRQRVEENVRRQKFDVRGNLFDIGDDVAVGKNHAFGRALGA